MPTEVHIPIDLKRKIKNSRLSWSQIYDPGKQGDRQPETQHRTARLTCVPSLHTPSLGTGSGQLALFPSQYADAAHSVCAWHSWFESLLTKVQVRRSQHGPSLGLWMDGRLLRCSRIVAELWVLRWMVEWCTVLISTVFSAFSLESSK